MLLNRRHGPKRLSQVTAHQRTERGRIGEVVRLLAGALDGATQLAQHQPLGRVPAGVQVDRPEDGLEAVGEDRGLGAAA